MVDYFFICDTGSTDTTQEIARDFLKTRKGKLFIEEWQNFGYNRTKSFEFAQDYLKRKVKDLDLKETYGVLLDADMKLVQGTLKEQNLTDIGYSLLQMNGPLEYYNARIIRMDHPWKCTGVTHEYWDAPCTKLAKEVGYIADYNDGGCKHDKFERDARLLEKGLKDEPENVRYMFYLAQTYKCSGKQKEAIQMYKKRIKAGGWDEEIWYSYYMIGECHHTLKNFAKFEYYMQMAHMFRPSRTESIHKLIKFFREVGHCYKAYQYIQVAKSVAFPKDDVLFVEGDVYRGLVDYETSIVEFYIHPEKCLQTTIEYLLKLPHFMENCISNLKFSVKRIESMGAKVVIPQLFDTSFRPSALSVLDFPYANVRFVNYVPPKDGNYVTPDGSPIQTKNAYFNFQTNEIFEMKEEEVEKHDSPVKGLEDLRLYKKDDKQYFTATSFKEYSKDRICIVHGEYDVENKLLKNCVAIDSPTKSNCEKNWVAVPGTSDFIYSWHPLRIGTIKNSKIIITKEISTPPFFAALRGSASPMEWNGKWLTIVHFVEYCQPRKYYHCFVELNKYYIPLRISLPFLFKESGIEYCLSTRMIDSKVIECYVSFIDADLHALRISTNHLKWVSINNTT